MQGSGLETSSKASRSPVPPMLLRWPFIMDAIDASGLEYGAAQLRSRASWEQRLHQGKCLRIDQPAGFYTHNVQHDSQVTSARRIMSAMLKQLALLARYCSRATGQPGDVDAIWRLTLAVKADVAACKELLEDLSENLKAINEDYTEAMVDAG
ncbi:hypothetical protein WJX72_000605 [[Myrmecia] bisecta]|uniref:Uncharacterized protein n=1 Tax=[Myrmecia] bisecta TaxID=41462 RepID=A0AAW1PWR9_9CHLO